MSPAQWPASTPRYAVFSLELPPDQSNPAGFGLPRSSQLLAGNKTIVRRSPFASKEAQDSLGSLFPGPHQDRSNVVVAAGFFCSLHQSHAKRLQRQINRQQ